MLMYKSIYTIIQKMISPVSYYNLQYDSSFNGIIFPVKGKYTRINFLV